MRTVRHGPAARKHALRTSRPAGCYLCGVDALLRSSIDLAAEKSTGQRLAETLELMNWGIQMKRAQLRARHPTVSEQEINRLLLEWLCYDD